MVVNTYINLGMFYINKLGESNYSTLYSLATEWLNSVEFVNLVSSSAGGTMYIYETVCFLYAGYLSVLTSDSLPNAQPQWAEILSFIVSASAADILKEFRVGDLFKVDDAILNSLIVSYATKQNSGMSLFFNAPALFVLENPELVDDAGDSITNFFFSSNIVNLTLLKTEPINYINMFSFSLVSYVCFLAVVYFFVVIYLYSNNKLNSSETSADNDFISLWALSESEKELGSADDLIFLIICLTYIFGWFFGTYLYFMVSKLPEFTMFMYLIPGIFYVVFSVPSYLIYDYGLYYGAYLRGASVSSFFLYELGYDIIMISVFYIRLALQAIRLVLMLIACASYYDYVMFYNFKASMFIGQTPVIKDASNFNVIVYWLLIKIPGIFLYVSYEVLHLWFILISQTLAFFAMIFWLFLYLYSFFLSLTVENHFRSARVARLNKARA